MRASIRGWRGAFAALLLSCGAIAPAPAQVSVGIGVSVPGVSIGINVPAYPRLVRVPAYPVYYAPGLDANFFFYDGLYWVYVGDSWYESTWYNGPWALVEPAYVPLYVLRVPVRYYQAPPPYFRPWRADGPPRWGDHWGGGWQRQHRGWDRWDRRAAPPPAPLPVYQRQYSGNRYPAPEQQRALLTRDYRYQPRDAVVRQRFQQAAAPAPATPTARPAPQREQRPVPVRPERQAVPARPEPHAAPAPMRPQAQAHPVPPPPHGREESAARPLERGPVQAAPQGHAVSAHPPPRPEAPAARPPQAVPPPAARAPQESRGQGGERRQGQGQGQERGEGRGEKKD